MGWSETDVSVSALRISEVEPKYYADGEDAYAMRRDLSTFAKANSVEPADPSAFWATKEERANAAAASHRSAKK